MTPEKILRELSKWHDAPPVDVLNAALARKAELGPLFIAEIDRLVAEFEDIIENAASDTQYFSMIKKVLRKPSPLFYGFLLAAEWKQTEAYPHYVKLLSWNLAGWPTLLSEIVFNPLAARIMAEIYNGDPEPLFSLLLDKAGVGGDSIRFWQWQTLILLVSRGALDLDTLRRFLVRAFDDLEQEPEQHVWIGWEAVIIYFGLDDLVPLVEKAHAVERIPGETVEEFRENYAYARAHPEDPIREHIVPFEGLQEELFCVAANREHP